MQRFIFCVARAHSTDPFWASSFTPQAHAGSPPVLLAQLVGENWVNVGIPYAVARKSWRGLNQTIMPCRYRWSLLQRFVGADGLGVPGGSAITQVNAGARFEVGICHCYCRNHAGSHAAEWSAGK